MSELLKGLKAFCAPGDKALLRRYVQLLRSDRGDPTSINALAPLMARLGKTISQVEADKAVLSRVDELRSAIGRAKDVIPHLGPAQKEMLDHQDETQRILTQREAEYENVRSTFATLQGQFNPGEAAIEELTQLKNGQYADLLADEPPVSPGDLK